ncbi:MAG TPA: division/cell wall cluster transcriptional repressor MraZ [Gemmatimonadota bacterium]|nr:division/cell wall cluster transcriptional repressor MraZ [Gemmatimonadota bacterium]
MGQFKHSVDEKGRANLPARFRDGEAGGQFVATRGLGRSLFLYPLGEWEKVLARLERQKARVDPKQRRNYLQLMEHTADAALDAQGRVTIPPHLAQHAGIKKEVLFVGAGEVIEMWDPATYRKYVGGSEKDFDAWMTNFL